MTRVCGFDGDMPIARVLPVYFQGYAGADNQFECPLPLSPEFWRAYCEPVEYFLQNALGFLAALEPVSTRRPGAAPSRLEWLIEQIGRASCRERV